MLLLLVWEALLEFDEAGLLLVWVEEATTSDKEIAEGDADNSD